MPQSKESRLPLIFGESRRVFIIEVLLRNLIENENKWISLSEVARRARISKSTVKVHIDQMRTDLIEFRPNTYSSSVKNPIRHIRLDENTRLTKELAFFYRKLRGII